MPAFNEEENIGFMLEESVKVLQELTEDWEILVIDDVSRDRTAQIVEEFAATQPEGRVKLIRNSRNIGCHPSEMLGMLAARGEYRFFNSSDRQILPQEIYRFLPALENGADLVYSWRRKRADPLTRRFISKVYNLLERFTLGIKLHDSHSVIVARGEVVDKVVGELTSSSAFLPIELVVRAADYGYRVDEVIIEHHPRLYGKQTGVNLKDVLKTPRDLFKFWRNLNTIKGQVKTTR